MGIDPISLTLLAATSAIGAAKSIGQGNAQGAQYDAEAALARRQAGDVDLQATQMSEKRRQDLRAGLSAIAARRAGAGVGLDSPTAQAIEANYIRNSVRDENIDRLGYSNQKYALLTHAAMDTSAAHNARTAGYLGAAGSFVGGFSNLYGSGLLGGGHGGGAPSPMGGSGYNTDGLY